MNVEHGTRFGLIVVIACFLHGAALAQGSFDQDYDDWRQDVGVWAVDALSVSLDISLASSFTETVSVLDLDQDLQRTVRDLSTQAQELANQGQRSLRPTLIDRVRNTRTTASTNHYKAYHAWMTHLLRGRDMFDRLLDGDMTANEYMLRSEVFSLWSEIADLWERQ